MQIIETNLTCYELSDSEQLRGALLIPEQIAAYRNEILRLTQIYIAIRHDLANPLATIAEQIALQAQLGIYNSLIATHFSVMADSVNTSDNLNA